MYVYVDESLLSPSNISDTSNGPVQCQKKSIMLPKPFLSYLPLSLACRACGACQHWMSLLCDIARFCIHSSRCCHFPLKLEPILLSLSSAQMSLLWSTNSHGRTLFIHMTEKPHANLETFSNKKLANPCIFWHTWHCQTPSNGMESRKSFKLLTFANKTVKYFTNFI